MEALPKMDGPNEGGLFIAFRNGETVGIAGLPKFNGQDAELKRMYIRPKNRGLG